MGHDKDIKGESTKNRLTSDNVYSDNKISELRGSDRKEAAIVHDGVGPARMASRRDEDTRRNSSERHISEDTAGSGGQGADCIVDERQDQGMEAPAGRSVDSDPLSAVGLARRVRERRFNEIARAILALDPEELTPGVLEDALTDVANAAFDIHEEAPAVGSMSVCPRCGGTGGHPVDRAGQRTSERDCPRCGGTGGLVDIYQTDEIYSRVACATVLAVRMGKITEALVAHRERQCLDRLLLAVDDLGDAVANTRRAICGQILSSKAEKSEWSEK